MNILYKLIDEDDSFKIICLLDLWMIENLEIGWNFLESWNYIDDDTICAARVGVATLSMFPAVVVLSRVELSESQVLRPKIPNVWRKK